MIGLTDQQLHQRVSEQRYVKAAHTFEMMVRPTLLTLLTLMCWLRKDRQWYIKHKHTGMLTYFKRRRAQTEFCFPNR